ncbi:MAG TPA: pilin, partial [Burkholderiaceae bacterium]
VSSVQIVNGAIDVTFSERAMPALRGKVLTYRPAVVPGEPLVPIAWVCGNASAPPKMVAQGANATNIDPTYLPNNCK